jgi:hypothetical protein
MKGFFSVFIPLFIVLTASAQKQEPDSDELEKRNGFKYIKLNYPTDSIRGLEFKKDFFEKPGITAKLYTITDPDLNTIGAVEIKAVRIKSYRDLVYEIEVITGKDPRLMRGMEKVLGKPSYSVRTNVYSWRSKSVKLSFAPQGNNELRLLYRSYPVLKLMAEDSGRSIEQVSDDF